MAKITYIDIPPEMVDKYYGELSPTDRYYLARMTRKTKLFSRPRLASITARSMLPQVTAEWNAFSAETKNNWKLAGQKSGYSGWQTYLQDRVIMLKHAIAGLPEAGIERQGWVGYITIQGSATEMELIQFHPYAYWVLKKKSGTKSQYELIRLTENVTMPFKIGISYKADLELLGHQYGEGQYGENQYGDGWYIAEFYARIVTLKDGGKIDNYIQIRLNLNQEWTIAEETLSSISGTIYGYQLYIHLKNVAGTLEFDNVIAQHSGQNWARDKRCSNISRIFTRQYYNVPKHWLDIISPAGAYYGTKHYKETF